MYARPSPGVILGHNKAIKIGPALYPFTHSNTDTYYC